MDTLNNGVVNVKIIVSITDLLVITFFRPLHKNKIQMEFKFSIVVT